MYGARNGKDDACFLSTETPSSIKISCVLRVIPKKQNK